MAHRLVHTEAVVAIETQETQEAQAVPGGSSVPLPSFEAKFVVVRKSYSFAFAEDVDNDLDIEEYLHFGQQPYEAMYSGLFVEQRAVRMYMEVFDLGGPLTAVALEANRLGMEAKVVDADGAGNALAAYTYLHQLALLDSALGDQDGEDPVDVLPSLQRCLHSAAAWVRDLVDEIRSLRRVLQADRAAPAGGDDDDGDDDEDSEDLEDSEDSEGSEGSDVGRRRRRRKRKAKLKSREKQLRHASRHLRHIRKRLEDIPARGHLYFAGLAPVFTARLEALPSAGYGLAGPAAGPALDSLATLENLLEASYLTMAESLAVRCGGVEALIQRYADVIKKRRDEAAERAANNDKKLNIKRKAIKPGAGGEAGPRAELQFVLDVAAETAANKESHAAGHAFAREAVLLQYAVDTRLDEVLQSLLLELTEPPLLRNPYSRLVRRLRSQGVKMELWGERDRRVMRESINDIVVVESPAFIYRATAREGELADLEEGPTGAAARARAAQGGTNKEKSIAARALRDDRKTGVTG
eukprot:CAMPEP_0182898984 /NCGR_PEP_ID=MMETSP0034_2-20130328/27810_1 /TAXON_ID=156128 /ORGANISM="Nephroselmis pyriformis, Strain CCMP717" /LENGTH=524 /DNA_ID=CAMNT_0025032981 /DNA_START=40 /DNA_END=1611 /DNA_ORIENTATION=+